MVIVIRGAYKEYQDKNLLHTNPEAWKAKKEEEAAEKERKRKAFSTGAAAGFNIARMFFWK
jgi:hypothetical protein